MNDEEIRERCGCGGETGGTNRGGEQREMPKTSTCACACDYVED
jgi:hypothetical protein